MDEELVRILGKAGFPGEPHRFADGSEVLVLPHGGRIIGLFAPSDPSNFYWSNSALKHVDTARELLTSDRWHNTGGERTWLSPEIDFFFPNYPDTTVYHQPRSLDPGLYRMAMGSGFPRLIAEINLKSFRTASRIRLQLSKAVEQASDPLRGQSDGSLETQSYQFAGYTLRTSAELVTPSDRGVSVGLWSLTQLPHGGQMIIPTYGCVKPVTFFGNISPTDLCAEPNHVRFRMRAPGEQKISVRAISCTGRIGYLHHSDLGAELVVRNFFVNPSGTYVDAMWSNPTDTGYCVQACSVNNVSLGEFSELEYHVPAICSSAGVNTVEDVSQVWAYRGSRGCIARIAEKLLGVSNAETTPRI